MVKQTKSTGETEYTCAVAGQVTEAAREVAVRERREPEVIRAGVAAGRIVIPANRHHAGLVPMGIGRELSVKINANLGTSALAGDLSQELAKLETAVAYGADTVMDLSTGPDAARVRQAVIAHSHVPVGTVPIYDAAGRVDDTRDLSAELLLEVIAEQAAQGVDYMTVHAGLLRKLPATLHDREGWARDIQTAFSTQRIEPSSSNLCAVLAVVEQESGYRADPLVPGLGGIAIAEIRRRAAEERPVTRTVETNTGGNRPADARPGACPWPDGGQQTAVFGAGPDAPVGIIDPVAHHDPLKLRPQFRQHLGSKALPVARVEHGVAALDQGGREREPLSQPLPGCRETGAAFVGSLMGIHPHEYVLDPA